MSYKCEENNIEGWTDCHELDWLYGQAEKMESVVEIGVWKGRSSHALLSGCKGPVYCVDHFQGSTREPEAHKEARLRDISVDFMENVGKFPNLKLIKMDSVEASKQFEDKSIDMIFIDGGHDYETINADLKAWIPKIKKLICGHDITQDGVPKALKEHFPDGVVELGNIWAVSL